MTEHAYILGHPVGHSKSPAMHDAAYRALGWDWEYGFADCATEDEARAFLESGKWRACNVTTPYKPLALDFADAPSAAALIAGGANVLVRDEDGAVFADNTDGAGCVAYLQRCGVEFADAWVGVCGTGPTAISIMHACACAQAGGIALFSRDAQRAAHALERYAETFDEVMDGMGAIERYEDPWAGLVGNIASAEFIADRRFLEAWWDDSDGAGRWDDGRPLRYSALAYEDSPISISCSRVLIDATSLGMRPDDPAPFDTALLRPDQVVFDVVYGHGETALMQAARAAGCRAFSGEGMLVGQAVETLRDIADVLPELAVPDDADLFAIMAEAAGFQL